MAVLGPVAAVRAGVSAVSLPRRAAPARLLVLLLALVIAATLARAPYALAAQAAAPLFTAEQAAVVLAPLTIVAADLPPGYESEGRTYNTASGSALQNTPAGGDPHLLYARYSRQGYILTTTQVLGRVSASLPGATFLAYFMKDEYRARDHTDGRLDGPLSTDSSRVEPLALPEAVGDASAAWHIVTTLEAGTTVGNYLLHWQRGRLSFSLVTSAPYGREKLDEALALVGAVDAKIVKTLPAEGAVPAVATPVSEDERIDAATRLRTMFLSQSAALADFRSSARSLLHPAGAVLSSSNPVTALRRYDAQLGRVFGVMETLLTAAGANGPRMRVYSYLDTDPTAAQADMAYESGGHTAADAIAPPLALGDTTLAFRMPVTTDNSKTVNDFVDIYWTHGSVLLNVDFLAPAVLLTDEFIAGVIQTVEAAYQASALASPRPDTAPPAAPPPDAAAPFNQAVAALPETAARRGGEGAGG